MIVFQRWYLDKTGLFYYEECFGLNEYFGNEPIIDRVGTEIVEGDLRGTYYTCVKVI